MQPESPFAKLLARAMSRRTQLKSLGVLALYGSGLPLAEAQSALGCTIPATMTEGPYWVDEKLHRANVTTGTTRASVLNAVPMQLEITLYDTNGQACGSNAARNVQVDIWHCDAAGEYSDVSGQGQSNTLGQDFLRGYQVAGNNGMVSFDTIYPGWYPGRATHIHLRARVYSAAGNTTYNFVSQLFFDDSFTDQVYGGRALYNVRGANRVTRNNNDGIFRDAGSAAPLLRLSHQSDGSVLGQIALGLAGLPATAQFQNFSAAVTNSGNATTPNLNLALSVASADVGATGEIYVAADVGGQWYFSNGSSWVRVGNPRAGGFPARFRGVLQASHNLNILSGMDTSRLGRVQIYAGYGVDNLDLIQNQRYRHVHTLNG